jgi:hypothetical protein
MTKFCGVRKATASRWGEPRNKKAANIEVDQVYVYYMSSEMYSTLAQPYYGLSRNQLEEKLIFKTISLNPEAKVAHLLFEFFRI